MYNEYDAVGAVGILSSLSVLTYIYFSLCVAFAAIALRDRSFIGWFFISVFCTPLLASIFLIGTEHTGKACSRCQMTIPKNAGVCGHCQHQVDPDREYRSISNAV